MGKVGLGGAVAASVKASVYGGRDHIEVKNKTREKESLKKLLKCCSFFSACVTDKNQA